MSKERQAVIEMDYPGSVISVNHYKGWADDGNTFTRKEAKDWMEELGWTIKPLHLERWRLPLTIRCSGTFKDKRSTPDLSNLSKCTLDAIEDATGINDRGMRWQDGDITYGDKPVLTIEITEGINNEFRHG